MVRLEENKYGKSRVRLVKVSRTLESHELKEWNVFVFFQGDFESCFLNGDNSKILPTDTMKNTVYSIARNSGATCIEEFAKELISYFLDRNPQVSSVTVEIIEKAWEHILANGIPHPTAFQQVGPAVAVTKVSRKRGEMFSIQSGIQGLVILKTAKSAFAGYIKDPLTTLPETHDRLFGTEATITWSYTGADHPFAEIRKIVTERLLTSFAEHDSLSVQHTLFQMGKDALEASPALADIELTMPNRHCLLVDLSRFGQDNPNEIFVPTDEPHGYIEARVIRD
jgi:urate oxidase